MGIAKRSTELDGILALRAPAEVSAARVRGGKLASREVSAVQDFVEEI
jgi:hypothetical protein